MRIVEDDLTGAEITALLRYHLEQMHLNSPPGTVFAFDIERLRAPDVTFWSIWNGSALLGCGALKDLGDNSGEIKSMRTAPAHLRKGVAAMLLDHIIAVASGRNYHRVSLETGSSTAFEPALALYRQRGFMPGKAFGDYADSAFNTFHHLDLGDSGPRPAAAAEIA